MYYILKGMYVYEQISQVTSYVWYAPCFLEYDVYIFDLNELNSHIGGFSGS